MKPLPALAV